MKPTHCISLCLSVLLLTCVGASFSLASKNPYISNHGINFSTGNKYLRQNDISLSGPVSSLTFSRNYNSQSVEDSVLGFGWSFSWNEKLTFETELGLAIYTRADGRTIHFTYNGTDAWINDVGKKAVITAAADSTGYIMSQPNGTRLFFDADGRLIEKRDSNNNTTFLTYDGDKLSTLSDGFGRSVTFIYNGEGKLDSIITPIGTYTYTYDSNGNLISVARPDNATRTYLYEDSNDIHNLTGVINETSTRILSVSYDLMDRVISSALTDGSKAVTIDYQSGYKRVITNSLGVSTTYQLEVLHGVAQVKSFEGPGCSSCGSDSGSTYSYNFRQQVTEMTDDLGTTTYTYDDRGNKLTEKKAVGTAEEYTISYTYNKTLNKVATITLPSVGNPGKKRVISMDYSAEGNLQTRTETGYSSSTVISRTTTYSYDSYGRISSIDGPLSDVNDVTNLTYYPNDPNQGSNRGYIHTVSNGLNHTVTYSSYNSFGLAELVTNAYGLTTRRMYNAQGLISSSTIGGLTTTYDYDSANTLQTVTLPGNRTISYTYTPAGQVNAITDSIGNSIMYTYDSEGRKTGEKVRDPEGTLTRFMSFNYNDAGQISKVILPGETERTYDYDNIGNLVQTINGMGSQNDMSYDVLGRLILSVKNSASTTYQYNTNSNITAVTDALERTTSFTYDDFNNRLSRSATDTGSTFYTYDKAGNLETITDALNRIVGFSYDALNRPVRQTYGSKDVLFTYDKNPNGIGRLSSITDEHGSRSFLYNNTGTLASETRQIGAQNYTTNYTYSATTGNLSGRTYPSSTAIEYNRNSDGQIVSVNVDGTTIIDAITRLPFGPLKMAQLAPTEGTGIPLLREYNQRYQLMGYKVGKATTPINYTRNAEGYVTSISNILEPTQENIDENYTYDPVNNRLTARGAKTYTYDAVGNLVSDGSVTFTYDELNRITQVNNGDTIVATYGYDSSNRRIIKTIGTTTTHYLYDASSNLIGETLADGTPLRDYIYLDGELLVLKEYQNNPGLYYYINDHLGTPQQLIKSDGTAVWQAAYLPFGKAQVIVEGVKNNIRFPGQYYDSETGLHYNWNRYYDAETGRYITADPIGLAGGINLYAYVQGDPVNWIDPEGLITWTGNIYQASFVPAIGATGMRAVFESECVDGKKAIVEVWIAGPAIGVGGGYKSGSGTGSSSTWQDHNDSIKPSAFNGTASMAQINAVQGVGFSYMSGIFGDVFTDGSYGQFGISSGFDWSISIMAGSSTVMDIQWECCE